MCGHEWSFIAMYGHVWLCVVMYGLVTGHAWSYLAVITGVKVKSVQLNWTSQRELRLAKYGQNRIVTAGIMLTLKLCGGGWKWVGGEKS